MEERFKDILNYRARTDVCTPINIDNNLNLWCGKYLTNFDGEELASAIDQAIAEAVSEGISEAAAQAGIQALLDVLAAGGSEQEAWDAGCAAAGLEKGC